MSRRGCTCSQCAPIARATDAGSNARCPNGHQAVELKDGSDQAGKYLDARCKAPGCGAQQRFRREDLG